MGLDLWNSSWTEETFGITIDDRDAEADGRRSVSMC